jgi:hypothetical protein
MKLAVILSLIFFSFLMPCSAQGNKSIEGETNDFRTPKKVIKNGGWDIPINGEIEYTTERNIIFDNYPVKIKWSKPKNQVYLRLIFHSLNKDGSLTADHAGEFKVISFGAYTAEEKIFAYKIYCLASSESAIIVAYFADEDGDGMFETRYQDELPEVIPDWIPKDEDKIERPPPPIKRVSKP